MRIIFAIVFALLPGWPILQSSASQVWDEQTPMPEGRSGMIAFVTNESEPAYYGGSSWDQNGKHIHRSGYRLSGGAWLPLEPLSHPVAYAAVAPGKTVIHAAGGTDGNGLYPSLLVLKSSLQQTEIEIDTTQARIYAGAAWVNGAFYQFGGSKELSPLSPAAGISKLQQGSWNSIGHLPEGPLINPAVAAWKESCFVLGGGTPDTAGLKNTKSVYSFDTREHTWTQWTDLPSPARGAVALSVPDAGILVVGGFIEPEEFASQVLLFDPGKNKFKTLPHLPTGLLLPAAVSTGKWLYVFGGEDAARHRSQRVFRTKLSELLENKEE